MAKGKKRYTIVAKLEVEADVEITADSLEDAVAQARTLKVPDFVSFTGEFVDGKDVEIKGVWTL